MHYAKIVHADVCKLRAAGNLADRPYTLSRRLQPLVDLDISPVAQLHAGEFEPKSFRIRSAAGCDEQVSSRQGLFSSALLDDDAYRPSRLAADLPNPRMQNNVDAFVFKKIANRLTNVLVFLRHQPLVAVEHGNSAAESPHGLRHFHSHVAAANYQQMFGNFVEFE